MNKIKWWQWILIIIFVGIIFYLVYPKYEFKLNGVIRCNKITGKVQRAKQNHNGNFISPLKFK